VSSASEAVFQSEHWKITAFWWYSPTAQGPAPVVPTSYPPNLGDWTIGTILAHCQVQSLHFVHWPLLYPWPSTCSHWVPTANSAASTGYPLPNSTTPTACVLKTTHLVVDCCHSIALLCLCFHSWHPFPVPITVSTNCMLTVGHSPADWLWSSH
jgi:hypothetical protein